MSVILLLIFFSLLVACGFLAAFLWAVRTGQYDDQFTPSVRILFENEKIKEKKIITTQETKN
jgi:cbb3-type cytochrome oxidase maturation protein